MVVLGRTELVAVAELPCSVSLDSSTCPTCVGVSERERSRQPSNQVMKRCVVWFRQATKRSLAVLHT